MPDAMISLGIDVQLGDLIAALQKAEGLTEAQATKLVKGLEKSVNAATKASKAAERAQRDAATAARELRDKFGGLGDVAQALGLGPLDTLATKGEALVRGFADLGVSAGAGIAIAGLAGVGVAAAGSVVGVVAATRAAEKYAEQLDAFRDLEGFGVTPEALATIERANASLDALGTIAKQAVVVLGEEFAPAIEAAGTQLVAFALMALDAWEQLSQGDEVLRDLAVWLTNGLVQALLAPATALTGLVGLMGDLADAVGMDGLAASLQAVDDSYDAWTKSVAGTAVDFYAGLGVDAMGDLAETSGDYYERAKELIGVQVEVGNKTSTAAKASRDQAAALKEAEEGARRMAQAEAELGDVLEDAYQSTLDPMDALLRKQELELAKVRALGMASGDRAKASEALAAVEMRQAKEAADIEAKLDGQARDRAEQDTAARIRLEEQVAAAKANLASTAFGAVADLADMASEKDKEHALEWFRVAQASAMVQVAINTIVASSKAFAELGPVAGAFAAIAMGITGGVQEAMIASQSPPSFYAGGADVGGSAGHLAMLHGSPARPETIVDAATTAAAGGPSEIQRRARGVDQVMSFNLDGREFSAAMASSARRGGRLSDEMTRRTGRLGRV